MPGVLGRLRRRGPVIRAALAGVLFVAPAFATSRDENEREENKHD